MNRILIWIKSLISILYYPVFRLCNYKIQRQDLLQWCNVLTISKYRYEFITFIKLFATLKEYRSLVLWRASLEWLPCSRENIHFVVSPHVIGGGFVLQHGFGSILFPKRIGENVQIWHNVTIGRNGKTKDNPIIGNNVKICAGAIVIGNITIGDNVIIGAGAVVVKDVPSGAVIVGNPARVIIK